MGATMRQDLAECERCGARAFSRWYGARVAVLEQRVEANGLQFGLLSEGDGPLVLLLHGFPDTAHTWDHVRPRLAAAGYRAVSPFMRGYHPTALPREDTDPGTLARDVLGLIDALGERTAILVGHDWGALAAYGASALAPDKVTRLVTVAIPHPATLRPTPTRAWGFRHFAAFKLPGASAQFGRNLEAGLRDLCRRWSPTWNPAPDELAAVIACFAHPGSLDAAIGYYRAFPLRLPDLLRQPIEVPTVVFAGQDDPIVLGSDYEAARRMFSSEYAIEPLPGGHFLHREQPDRFADRLLARLAP